MAPRPRYVAALARFAVLVPVIAFGGGCATASKVVEEDPFARASRPDEIRIEVLNNNFSDATLWAIVQDTRRIRLGTVTGKTDSIFTLPWTFSFPLRIEIDMVAGPRCVTRAIETDPGDLLQLEIQSVFRDTRYCERF